MNARRGTLAVTDDGTTGGRGAGVIGTASGSGAEPERTRIFRFRAVFRLHLARPVEPSSTGR